MASKPFIIKLKFNQIPDKSSSERVRIFPCIGNRRYFWRLKRRIRGEKSSLQHLWISEQYKSAASREYRSGGLQRGRSGRVSQN